MGHRSPRRLESRRVVPHQLLVSEEHGVGSLVRSPWSSMDSSCLVFGFLDSLWGGPLDGSDLCSWGSSLTPPERTVAIVYYSGRVRNPPPAIERLDVKYGLVYHGSSGYHAWVDLHSRRSARRGSAGHRGRDQKGILTPSLRWSLQKMACPPPHSPSCRHPLIPFCHPISSRTPIGSHSLLGACMPAITALSI